MKATDLMIGDWVRINYRNKVAQVTEIVEKAIGTTAISPLSKDEFEPIPLTPEILEKNGWERLTTDKNECWGMEALQYNEEQHLVYIINWRFDTWQPRLSIRSFTPEHGTFEMFHICFVHELQHALKLCGIDKEIVL